MDGVGLRSLRLLVATPRFGSWRRYITDLWSTAKFATHSWSGKRSLMIWTKLFATILCVSASAHTHTHTNRIACLCLSLPRKTKRFHSLRAQAPQPFESERYKKEAFRLPPEGKVCQPLVYCRWSPERCSLISSLSTRLSVVPAAFVGNYSRNKTDWLVPLVSL